MGRGLKPSPFYLLRKIAQIAVSELHAREVEVLPKARGSSTMMLVPTMPAHLTQGEHVPRPWRSSRQSAGRGPSGYPGITQEVAPNEGQRTPKPPNRETLIDEALFVALWLQSRFEKGS